MNELTPSVRCDRIRIISYFFDGNIFYKTVSSYVLTATQVTILIIHERQVALMESYGALVGLLTDIATTVSWYCMYGTILYVSRLPLHNSEYKLAKQS